MLPRGSSSPLTGWAFPPEQEQQAALEAAAKERDERLARLRALVAPEVDRDPKRVLQPTEASKAVDPEDDDPEAAPFRPVNGYSNAQLYRDPKFRLADALQRQGLHNTDYGRAAIGAAATVKATRPDNLTFMQRAASHR